MSITSFVIEQGPAVCACLHGLNADGGVDRTVASGALSPATCENPAWNRGFAQSQSQLAALSYELRANSRIP